MFEWVVLAGADFLLFWPTFITDGIGLVIVAGIWFMQKKAKNKREAALEEASI